MLGRREVADVMSRSDVGIVVLHSSPAYMEALPVKLFEYMAARIPLVASDFPIWREIVEGAECGYLVEPEEVDQLADAISRILGNQERAEEMGRRGRVAVEELYSWESEEKRLLSFVAEIANSH